MKNLLILSITILGLMLTTACSTVTGSGESSPEWAVKGTWTDACCCKVSCPCLFGNKPTEGFCQGASHLQIETGNYGDLKLDGLAVVSTHEIGKWAKIYVSDAANPKQAEALATLMPKVLPFLAKGPITKVETGPVSLERGESTVKFSIPETTVELALVEGADGAPIKLQNLPAKGTPFPRSHDHTQYKSILMEHKGGDESFSWSGRNGFVSTFDLAGGGD
jgi:hypothetical protein